MSKPAEILSGKGSWQEAHRRAIFGHKDWIAWVENDTPYAARLTAATLKRAMLAEGTGCRMVHYDAHGGFIVCWSIACNMLRQLKRACI